MNLYSTKTGDYVTALTVVATKHKGGSSKICYSYSRFPLQAYVAWLRVRAPGTVFSITMTDCAQSYDIFNNNFFD